MRLVLLADNVVGMRIAEYLLKNHLEDLSLVITTQRNEIYFAAEKMGVPVCIFDSAEGVLTKLQDWVDLGMLAWWPKIVKSPLLEAPRHGFVNTHPSLLPYNRGKHYNFWALVEQAPFGVTLHRVDSGIDSGDIIAQAKIHYDWTDNGGSLYAKAQAAMVSLFCQTYPLLRTGNFVAKAQDLKIGSFHHSSEIDFASRISLDATYKGRELLNLLRARTFEGYPGCWFEDAGTRYEISIKIREVK